MDAKGTLCLSSDLAGIHLGIRKTRHVPCSVICGSSKVKSGSKEEFLGNIVRDTVMCLVQTRTLPRRRDSFVHGSNGLLNNPVLIFSRASLLELFRMRHYRIRGRAHLVRAEAGEVPVRDCLPGTFAFLLHLCHEFRFVEAQDFSSLLEAIQRNAGETWSFQSKIST